MGREQSSVGAFRLHAGEMWFYVEFLFSIAVDYKCIRSMHYPGPPKSEARLSSTGAEEAAEGAGTPMDIGVKSLQMPCCTTKLSLTLTV